MRASRVLSIQMLLQARGRMSARSLAALLEVSVRTLHRDVDQLSAAGVPIYAERGRDGGFALRDGWKTSLTGLTAAESQAVFLSGLAGPAAQLGLGPEVASARLKLLAALPATARADAQRFSATLHLDPIDWYRETEPVPHLAAVAEAVWSERRLAMRYDSWTSRGRRTVDPLGLVLKAGTWYLVAATDTGPRTFRVSNIERVELLPLPIRRPKAFDLAVYWDASVKRFERELVRGHATVLATPAGLRGLRHLGGAVAKSLAVVKPSRRKDGRVKVRLPIESIAHAAGQLLRLAPEVEAIEPAALRDALVEQLRRSADLYGLARPAACGEGAARSSRRASVTK